MLMDEQGCFQKVLFGVTRRGPLIFVWLPKSKARIDVHKFYLGLLACLILKLRSD